MKSLHQTPRRVRFGVLCALCAGFALVGSWTTVPSTAFAQDATLESLTDEQKMRLVDLLNRGNTKFNKGQYTAALALYDEANTVVSLAEIQYRRALCLEKLEEYQKAVDAYRLFLRLDPDAREKGRIEAEIDRLLKKINSARQSFITLRTEPLGALVQYKDAKGRKLGETPVRIALKPGKHILYITKEGFEPRLETVQAVGGQTTPLIFQLEKEQPRDAELQIIVNPPKAQIRRDNEEGELLGVAPLKVRVPKGRGAVHVSAPNFKPKVKIYNLQRGQLLTLNMELEPVGGYDRTETFGLGLGLTIAGAVVGLGSGALWYLTEQRIQDANDFDRQDASNTREELNDIQEPIDALKVTTYATAGVAGLSLITGVILMIADDSQDPYEAASGARPFDVHVTPREGGAAVRFESRF